MEIGAGGSGRFSTDMKKLLLTISGIIALASAALAQSGTYHDARLSVPQRLILANQVLASGTESELEARNAALYMLSARPVAKLLAAFPAFDGAVIADPTLGGKLASPAAVSVVFKTAVFCKGASTPTLPDRIAAVQPFLSSTFSHGFDAAAIRSYYRGPGVNPGRAGAERHMMMPARLRRRCRWPVGMASWRCKSSWMRKWRVWLPTPLRGRS